MSYSTTRTGTVAAVAAGEAPLTGEAPWEASPCKKFPSAGTGLEHAAFATEVLSTGSGVFQGEVGPDELPTFAEVPLRSAHLKVVHIHHEEQLEA